MPFVASPNPHFVVRFDPNLSVYLGFAIWLTQHLWMYILIALHSWALGSEILSPSRWPPARARPPSVCSNLCCISSTPSYLTALLDLGRPAATQFCVQVKFAFVSGMASGVRSFNFVNMWWTSEWHDLHALISGLCGMCLALHVTQLLSRKLALSKPAHPQPVQYQRQKRIALTIFSLMLAW